MKTLRLAAALAAVLIPGLPASAATLPDADPALWVVKDHDTTIYLFGTFHVLDGKADWFNDEVRQAFDRSDDLVVEALIPEDPSTLAPIIGKYAMAKSGEPLTKRLSPEGQAKLLKIINDVLKSKTGYGGVDNVYFTNFVIQ